MPDYFSHCITAELIYENLDREHKKLIEDKTLYLLGAQGGDVFFAYNLKLSKTNLGRKLHCIPAAELFASLCQGDKSYLAGFAAHYALDCTLHPAVYAFENTTKSPMAHIAFESDLGLYISRKYAVPRKILPREKVVGATFPVYDSVKLLDDGVTVTGVERCLKRHFTYTRYVYRNKKQTYKFDYDYASLSGAVEDGVRFGKEAVTRALDGDIDEAVFSRSFLEK